MISGIPMNHELKVHLGFRIENHTACFKLKHTAIRAILKVLRKYVKDFGPVETAITDSLHLP